LLESQNTYKKHKAQNTNTGKLKNTKNFSVDPFNEGGAPGKIEGPGLSKVDWREHD
jgi:hypothetical protein